MATDEEILVEKARAGDRAAFDSLFAMHRRALEHVVRTKLGASLRSGSDAADVCQEAALRALQAIGRFRWQGDESFFRWLAGIASHIVTDLARRDGRHPEASLAHDVPGEDATPSQSLRRKERLDRLEEALKTLAPDHREVIRLARIEGLKVSEIAERMRRTPGAVRHLLLRALASLRESFGETDSLHLPEQGLDREGDSRGG